MAEMNVKITDDMLGGVYANSMRVMHTREEFLLDFMNLFPPQGMVMARVVISPGHLRRILDALNENLVKYEKKFKLKVEATEEPKVDIGFKQ